MRGGTNANSKSAFANAGAKPVSNAVANEGAKSSGIKEWFSSLFFKPEPTNQALLQKQNGPPAASPPAASPPAASQPATVGGRRRRKTKRVKFRRRKSLRR